MEQQESANRVETWRNRLYTPTFIQKFGESYFIVDCWHSRIIYSSSLDAPLETWSTLAADIFHGHTLASNGRLYLCDDTDHDSLRVFERTEDGFHETQRFSDIGGRPHCVTYNPFKGCFYALLSTDATVLRLEQNSDTGKLAVTERYQIPNVGRTYIRSFSLIDGFLYLVSGNGQIRKLEDQDSLRLVESIPVPDEFGDMNFLTYIDGWFYVTSYRQNGKTAPRFVRTRELSGLATGIYENLYERMSFQGVPYFISCFDGRCYITEINMVSGVKSFVTDGDDITDIRTHFCFEGATEESVNRMSGNGAVLYAEAYEGADIAEKQETEKVFRIGNARVDLSSYTGKDTYSDGDIEDELLLAARKGKLRELLDADRRWPVFYHIAPARENLLDWLSIPKDAKVLEIGCGCGALTRLLCQKVGHVEAVDISPRRAEIAAWRCSDVMSNLVIHVGNLTEIPWGKTFDIITLIGVLEYAPSFMHTEHPVQDFLAFCRKLLSSNGTLVIAIENRLGIKYWAGAAEDHTGKMFDGIQGYPSGKQVQTFSRKELQDMLSQSGLPAQEWYYCWPDYKLPLSLESDEYLPARGQLEFWHARAYDHPRVELFSEKQALKSLLSTGLYHEFANSFLVLAQYEKQGMEPLPLWVHETDMRREKYHIRTEIRKRDDGSRYVLKVAPTMEAVPHLHTIAENCRILTRIYGKQHIAQAKLVAEDKLEIEYAEGTTIAELLDSALERKDMQEFSRWINFFKYNVLRGEDDDMMMPKTVDFHRRDREYEWDLQFGNILIAPDGHFILYDYEFLVAKMSKKGIFWRVAMEFFAHNAEKMQQCGLAPEKIIQAMGVTDEMIRIYDEWTKKLVQEVFAKHARRYDNPVYQSFQIQCTVPGGK